MSVSNNGIVGNPALGQYGPSQLQVGPSLVQAGHISPGHIIPAPRPQWDWDHAFEGGFRVEKINNGFVVHLLRSQGMVPEKHYAEDSVAVGHLVTATLTRWFLEGTK